MELERAPPISPRFLVVVSVSLMDGRTREVFSFFFLLSDVVVARSCE
jgi:hypothetical protein